MASTADVDEYVRTTQVRSRVNEALDYVLRQENLPKSPWPLLVQQLRPWEVARGASEAATRGGGLERDEVRTQVAPRTHLSTVDGSSLCGLEYLVCRTSPASLSRLVACLRQLDGVWLQTESKDGSYTVRALTALVGPAVFFGSVLPYVPRVDLNHEYILEGPDFEKAVDRFVKHLLKQAHDTDGSRGLIVEGMYVQGRSRVKGGAEGIPRRYTAAELRKSWKGFARDAKSAALGRRAIYLDALCWLDVMGGRTVTLRKHYTLHFKATGRAGASGGREESFAAVPFESLATGVFFDLQDAERYAQLFNFPLPDDAMMLPHRQRIKGRLVELWEGGQICESLEELILICAFSNRPELDELTALFNGVIGQVRALVVQAEDLWKLVDFIVHDRSIDGLKLAELQQQHTGKQDGKTGDAENIDIICSVMQQYESFKDKILQLTQPQNSSDVMSVRKVVHTILRSMNDSKTGAWKLDDVGLASLESLRHYVEVLDVSLVSEALLRGDVRASPTYDIGCWHYWQLYAL